MTRAIRHAMAWLVEVSMRACIWVGFTVAVAVCWTWRKR